MLAERLKMLPIKNDFVSIQLTDTLWTNYMAVFQYLIGNADYSVAGRHNVKLLRYNDVNQPNLIPVPYDFDYSGLVNANYAIPGENIGISSVTERYFLGPCRPAENYKKVLIEFQSKKEEIYRLINSFTYLAEKERQSVISYLNELFDYQNESYFIEKSFLSTCQNK